MYSKIFILIVFALLGALSAVADEPSRNGRHNPFNQLQDQIEALDARIEALEDSAPNPGIDGRSYCSMLNVQIMRAFPGSQTETTQNVIVRRVVSFDGGVLNGPLLSRTLNDHSDIGTLSNTSNNPVIDPLVASYVQTGSKVDITFADGSTANWHASRDGSTISGMAIASGEFANGAVFVGIVRTWLLVETDPLDSCDAENE